MSMSDSKRTRCSLCGDFYEVGRIFVAAQGEVCNDCISNLIDNEAERRGLEEEERRKRQYFSGEPTQADRDRQDLIDAGRGHLT